MAERDHDDSVVRVGYHLLSYEFGEGCTTIGEYDNANGGWENRADHESDGGCVGAHA